jgi:hypothetical protein
MWHKFIYKRFGLSWPCCYVHKSIGGLSSQQFQMLAYAVIWILVIAVLMCSFGGRVIGQCISYGHLPKAREGLNWMWCSSMGSK